MTVQASMLETAEENAFSNLKETLPESKTVIDSATQLDKNPPIETPMSDKISDTRIKFTGKMLNFTRLQIQGDDLALIKIQLQKKLGQARQSSPIKLPLLVSCHNKLDLIALWDLLWKSGVQPIGITTGILDEQALAKKIPIFPADGERLGTLSNTNPSMPSRSVKIASQTLSENYNSDIDPAINKSFNVDTPVTSSIQGDRVHNQMVRSGQSINHVGGDLILTNDINAGAEAITDYSLHVYGKAEGRLVAGATGDSNARIFCLRFNPSLVSVAGTYCLRENIPTEFLNKAVQVSYDPQKGLVFQLMSA